MRRVLILATVTVWACTDSWPESPRQNTKGARLSRPEQVGPPPAESPRPLPGYPKWVIDPNQPVSDPAILPIPTHQVAPVYPAEAEQARIAGPVVLQLTIERDGRVSRIRVVKPLPFGLAEAAVTAVSQWTYRPGYDREGRAVRSLTFVNIHFVPPKK